MLQFLFLVNLPCQVGLAVGDIDKIQQNALMDRYVLQVGAASYEILMVVTHGGHVPAT